MGQSHATGKSVVPEAIQKVAPEALERALPDSVGRSAIVMQYHPNLSLQVHDTSVGGKHKLEKGAKKHI
jgi:hypothetical protein